MPNGSENTIRKHKIRIRVIVRFSSDFVPQGTEVVPQSRKSISSVKFGNDFHGTVRVGNVAVHFLAIVEELADEVDQVGK
jgi:hypothetical protein